ncbi:MAG: tRNA preQ1(34) S-adenosylmethionine ribosyltransferase-isomerase QueA [Pseudomonadota bacterium]
MFDIEEYNYSLPGELIAQVPKPDRASSRLLLVEREGLCFFDYHFNDLPRLLRSGDLLVVNNTRVVPARLFGRKGSGGKIEILILEHPDNDASGDELRWCLARSSKRPSKGTFLFFEDNVSGRVEDHGEEGLVLIKFSAPRSIDGFLEEKGHIPLPPYIKRVSGNGRSALDRERYQTIFARQRGAVAAPTAGLHFTEDLMEALKRAGVAIAQLTLHVGHGTFRPVRSRDIRNHFLGVEKYLIDQDTADAVNDARMSGRRVISVGTTVVRALESAAGDDGCVSAGPGETNLLITPGYRFKVIDGLITNFHLPKSSLLFLVSAFAGRPLVKKAYERAVEKEYRFYSYGDAMMIM